MKTASCTVMTVRLLVVLVFNANSIDLSDSVLSCY